MHDRGPFGQAPDHSLDPLPISPASRAFLLVAGVLAACGMGAMVAFQDLPGALALLVFAAIGVAMGVTPVCYASMRENNPPESAALSVAVLLTGSDLAAALTPYLAGRLAAAGDPADVFRPLWWALLGWACVWVAGASRVRETHAAHRWRAAPPEPAPGRPEDPVTQSALEVVDVVAPFRPEA